MISGALFGAGWWFWVDAVACSSQKIPFTQVGRPAAAIGAQAVQPAAGACT